MNHDLTLVIGDKAWSSWSLRPWLALARTGLPFKELVVELRKPDTAANIAKYSPSGRIPVLLDGDFTVWDSLAICEYVAELAPEAKLLPADKERRALCRSVSAEMHSSFYALRSEFPMDLNGEIAGVTPSPASAADIRRVIAIWRDLRIRFQTDGPYLLGVFSIADAMFAPVATRFHTYGIDLARFGDDMGLASGYQETVLEMPEMRRWMNSKS